MYDILNIRLQLHILKASTLFPSAVRRFQYLRLQRTHLILCFGSINMSPSQLGQSHHCNSRFTASDAALIRCQIFEFVIFYIYLGCYQIDKSLNNLQFCAFVAFSRQSSDQFSHFLLTCCNKHFAISKTQVTLLHNLFISCWYRKKT